MDPSLDGDLRADLERVEVLLRENADSDNALVREVAVHLIDAGGKRFRPMLTLLCGRLGDAKDPRLVQCAAAIELTHLATLYHDDVIDETTVRRGVETVNARYGNSIAVLTGDFLFARASGLAADLGSYVTRRLADTIAFLCEGQIMESQAQGRLDAATDHYLEVIRRKTAALISNACHLGTWISGAPEEVVAAMSDYGEAIGMSFQLADDILDVVGYPEDTGKVPGTDLRAGVFTLPVLVTLHGEVDGGDAIRDALGTADIEAALGVLRSNGSIERTREAAAGWAARARSVLAAIPDGVAKDALSELAGSSSDRRA